MVGRSVLLAWLVGAAIGAISLGLPFSSDPALFAYAAGLLSRGGTLYVDFWDLKQPGIYAFYTAGHLLGLHGTVGVRILESVWLGLGAACAAWLLIDGKRPGIWLPATLLTAGIYHICSTQQTASQVESLIATPILASVCLAMLAATKRDRFVVGAFTCGMSWALIGMFKLVLLPLGVAACAVALVLGTSSRRGSVLLRFSWWSLLGCLAGFLAIALYFHRRGSLLELLWTTFVFPFSSIGEIDNLAPMGRLLASGQYFLALASPLLGAAAVGLWKSVTSGTPRERVAAGVAVAWLVTGLVMILLQRFSWWRYHFMMLLWPVGMLASIGVTAAPSLWRSGSRAKRLLVMALGFSLVAGFADHLVRKVRYQAALDHINRHLPPTSRLAIAQRVAQGLDPSCDLVYVIGEPSVLLATGLRSAYATNGWSWKYYLDSQWLRLPRDLRMAAPRLIYIGDSFEPLIRSKAPDFLRLLSERYRPLEVDDEGGAWYTATWRDNACGRSVPFTIPGGHQD